MSSDINARKNRELKEKLEDCGNLFRTTFESTGNATIIIDEDTTIIFANSDFTKLSGYTREEIEGKMSWTEVVSPEDIPQMLEYHHLRREDAEKAPRNYEFLFVGKDGGKRNIYMTINMVPGSKRSIGSFTDITDRKKLESQIVEVSEMERHQLGNDLHDGLSPHLVGVQFLLKLFKRKIEKDGEVDTGYLDEINNLISQALLQTRHICKGLMPVDIQPDGLVLAMEELLHKTEKIYGVVCTLSSDESFALSDNISATHIYYIVQEAISNAIKHGRCTWINVILESYEQYLTISIRDNGTGMPDMPMIEKGIGLSSMSYRANIIGASLDILQNDSGGVTIFCRLRKDDRFNRKIEEQRIHFGKI